MLDPLGDGISSVQLIAHMGDDLMVVNAARVSYAKESMEFIDADQQLLRYMATHHHWTPFSHPQLQFRIKMPYFIAREWYRHSVGLTRNEVSRRYVKTAPEYYVPTGLREPDPKNKQGSQGVSPKSAQHIAWMKTNMDACMATYNMMIDGGIAAEQARIVLPMGTYTEFIETGSLAAYARICGLRVAPDAQAETRTYAEAASQIIQPLFPFSWKELTSVGLNV